MWLFRLTLATGQGAILLFWCGLVYCVWALTIPLSLWAFLMLWLLMRVLQRVEASRRRAAKVKPEPAA
jgi:hypothetical protein